MSKTKRVKTIGSSKVEQAHLEVLQTAWGQRRLTLCLGAGVSQPYGIPGWNELVLSFLISSADPETWQYFYPSYRKALSEWMMDYFDVSPIALARLFVEGGRANFMEKLRATLYQKFQEPENTSLDAVVGLIKRAREADREIKAIITLNYDDVLEGKLRAAGIDCSSVIGAESDEVEGIPIIHAHGFLPREGPIPDHELVLSETDYHRVMSTAFHWATLTLGWHVRRDTVLFIGVSLTDPSIRRLLDGCKPPGKTCPHVVLGRDFTLDTDDLQMSVCEVENRARRHARRMGRNDQKRPNELEAIMRRVCRRAQDYDRKMLSSLGVRVIRLRTFDDVRPILERIAR